MRGLAFEEVRTLRWVGCVILFLNGFDGQGSFWLFWTECTCICDSSMVSAVESSPGGARDINYIESNWRMWYHCIMLFLWEIAGGGGHCIEIILLTFCLLKR